MIETWKTIPNFSKYEASSLGNLRSRNYKRTGKVKNLKPTISPDGYYKTVIQTDKGNYKSGTVHLFVCLAFLGSKPEGKEINHKDGNKLNNKISNLEYVTRSENVLHSYAMGLQKPLRGSTNPSAKLTERDVLAIRAYVRNFKERYYGRKKLAQKYGVSESHIKDIISRRRNIWKHI